MTVAQLTDYMAQFPSETRVILSPEDEKLLPANTAFIVLAVLDFTEQRA